MFEDFDQIKYDDIDDHIFDLYTERASAAGENLGFVDRTKDTIDILLPKSQTDLTIRQSISSLSSTTNTSSTGFVCWKSALLLADWILSDDSCPLKQLICSHVVLELGTGVSSLLASTLGPLTKQYVASDQKHLLKLMKHNFVENVTTTKYKSSTVEAPNNNPARQNVWPLIDFIELDWEYPEWGMEEFGQLTGSTTADVIIACDTIYNSYLIPYFVKTAKRMMGDCSTTIVSLQLRDDTVMELFLKECLDCGLEIWSIPETVLSPELRSGFVVYCLRVKQ